MSVFLVPNLAIKFLAMRAGSISIVHKIKFPIEMGKLIRNFKDDRIRKQHKLSI